MPVLPPKVTAFDAPSCAPKLSSSIEVPSVENQRVITYHPSVPPGFTQLVSAPVPTPTISAPNQRVPSTVSSVKTAPAIRKTRLATKHRYKDFEALSDRAIKKLPQAIQRCLNLQYTDEHNALIQGTVSTVVRNKLTRKLNTVHICTHFAK